MSAELVPLHPEAVAGSDRELCWVVPPATFPFAGPVADLPDSLRTLLNDGTLASVSVEPSAVRTRLAPGRQWREEGARVRTALQSALASPEQWHPAEVGDPDEVLRNIVLDVIGGEVGAYVRSHGGDVRLIAVSDGEVQVRLIGACQHCPASGRTLTDRFAKAVRDRYPAVRSVVARGPEKTDGGRRWLGLTPFQVG